MTRRTNMEFLILTSLLAVVAPRTAAAVQYTVANNAAGTAGGTRFETEIGTAYTERQLLPSASSFIWETFQQGPTDRKPVDAVSMVVESFNGVALTSSNRIHLSSDYVGGYSGDVKREVTGVLYHEMVHVWQWDGKGQAPGWLIEGVADYVRLKAGLAPPHWVAAGGGDRWDRGYDVTARFLDYCGGLRRGFVAELNGKMKDGYDDGVFVELLGKSVDRLWADYKAKYGG